MISDLKIIETGDGGTLQLVNDDLVTIEGLSNQVYLAFFGGDDEFWGNTYLDDEHKFVSKLERRLNKVALNSAGLIDLISTAKDDLKYLQKYADVSVDASITGVNRVKFEVILKRPDEDSEKLTFIWDGTLKYFNNGNSNN